LHRLRSENARLIALLSSSGGAKQPILTLADEAELGLLVNPSARILSYDAVGSGPPLAG
jgi:hypothetical protein